MLVVAATLWPLRVPVCSLKTLALKMVIVKPFLQLTEAVHYYST